MSCLNILESTDKGKLLQVATGEGKSTIVAALAVINCLKGKKADIMTSSSVLAARDAKENKRLYELFGLSVSDNNDNDVYYRGAKSCYKNDVVYGDIGNFQFDALRDEYSGLGTLAGRINNIALIDEVDSMLIDDSSKIAKLANSMAGMDRLQPIYYFLWQRVNQLSERVKIIDDKYYLLNGQLDELNNELILKNDNTGKEIVIKDIAKQIVEDPIIGEEIGDSTIKNDLIDYLHSLIKFSDSKSENAKLEVPKHFEKLIKLQIPKWVDSAIIAAFQYKEDVHYIKDKGLIKPVDYSTTGVIQESTNWSDGLHQFLQIKHDLKMSSETFTTNFLSNMGYLKRYGTNLFGLTGTLGSDACKEALKNGYDVELQYIPSRYSKQYIQFSDVVVPNNERWLNEITESSINEARKGRGVLIICETIQKAQDIEKQLKMQWRKEAIKLYTKNNEDQEKSIHKIKPGEIIVATNLAGRGTDIKTDDIEKSGGLHVCVTFLPNNLRVEAQAIGRTARQGKCGTGQMIINSQSNVLEIKKDRDKFEELNLLEFREKDLKIITTKDSLFTKFCNFLTEIRKDIRRERGFISYIISKVIEQTSIYEVNVLAAIEERWAFFLMEIDDGIIKIDDAYGKYDQLINEIDAEYQKTEIHENKGFFNIKNPYYHIAVGNDLIMNDSVFNDKYDRAQRHYDQAIAIDENYSIAAYVGKAWLSLKGRERSILFDNKVDNSAKQDSFDYLNKALKYLYDEMSSLQAMLAMLKNQGTDLYKQLVSKTNILGSYIRSVESNIAAIEKSERLIDITGIDKDNRIRITINKLHRYKGLGELDEDFKVLPEELNKYNKFDIRFNSLTNTSDSGTKDQAINLISTYYRIIHTEFSLGGIVDLAGGVVDLTGDIFNKDKIVI